MLTFCCVVICESGQAKMSSTVLPRLAATCEAVVEWTKASKVARTMWWGWDEPWLLATISVTPSTSKTARIGPPAMMPAPLGAGAIITTAAPWWPVTLWGMGPFLSDTLTMLRRGSSVAFLPAARAFLGLPLAEAAVTVARHGQCGETENPAALDDLGHAVDLDHFFAQTVVTAFVLHFGLKFSHFSFRSA